MNMLRGNYKEYKLDNGLVVVLQNTPTQTIAAKLRVNYGTSHEREGEEGMAHFLEHCLVTGGSLKYDPIIADEIRGSFGSLEVFTNIGRTLFIYQMLAEDLETWFDYISDHVFRPRFDQDRVRGERERVLREISDAKSNPMYIVNIEYNNIFYRGHPKGGFILGKEEVVKNADKEKLAKFHSRGYNPNNIDLIILGSLPKNIERLIQTYFGGVAVGENARRDFPHLQPLPEKVVLLRPAPERLNADAPGESSAQIFLSFLGPINGHEDEYAVRVMNQLLGGDTNSLLFQNVGLKKGLVYQAETSINGEYNAGELGINAAVPAKRIEETVEAIFEEIQRIKTERVSDKSVERIKRMAKYNLTKAFESNEGHMPMIECKLDFGLTPESYIDGYNRITPERVIEMANKYLPDRSNGKYVLYIRNPLMQ